MRLSAPLHPRRWLPEVLVAVLFAFLALHVIRYWDQQDSGHDFPLALSDSDSGQPGGTAGYLAVTAAVLNAEQPALPFIDIRVRYVPAGEPSTGQWVVSVHPLSRTAWAGAALGPDGRCYAILYTADGQSASAEFPPGTPCTGSRATAATFTDVPES
jgi:hypothetical protein